MKSTTTNREMMIRRRSSHLNGRTSMYHQLCAPIRPQSDETKTRIEEDQQDQIETPDTTPPRRHHKTPDGVIERETPLKKTLATYPTPAQCWARIVWETL